MVIAGEAGVWSCGGFAMGGANTGGLSAVWAKATVWRGRTDKRRARALLVASRLCKAKGPKRK